MYGMQKTAVLAAAKFHGPRVLNVKLHAQDETPVRAEAERTAIPFRDCKGWQMWRMFVLTTNDDGIVPMTNDLL
jgi:hypothetical protein